MLRTALTGLGRLVLGMAFLAVGSVRLLGQQCAGPGTTTLVELPTGTDTTPGSHDLSLGGNSNYLYLITEWGVARGPIHPDGPNPNASPDNPGPFNLFGVGLALGSVGGVIPIHCDCFQGWNTFDVAESTDIAGTARIVGDWQPFSHGGHPPSLYFSGLPVQLTQTTGAGNVAFGQQLDLPDRVPQNSRVAAIYIQSTQKYFAYFPVAGDGIYRADVTNPTGNPNWQQAITSSLVASWNSSSTGGAGARIKAAHVSVSQGSTAYNHYLLVGATPGDLTLHVAEIDESGGTITPGTEVTTGISINPIQLDVAVVDNRVFIFSSEETSGMQVYEYRPFQAGGPDLIGAGSITGRSKRVFVRGDGQFPVLFNHRLEPNGTTFIDVYDTRWLTQPSTPILAASLPGGGFAVYGFEAFVDLTQNTAFVYREAYTAPPQQSIATTPVDISCLVDDPSARPNANLALTNLSASARAAAGQDGNYYLGDQWQIQDKSSSSPSAPIDQIRWDMIVPPAGAFTPDAAWSGSYSTLKLVPSAYFPCDPALGGDLVTGANCYASVGSPTTAQTYSAGVATHNLNGWSNDLVPAVVKPSDKPVNVPVVSILGLSGTTLQIISGGQAKGDVSQGNTDQATFDWTFAGAALSCPVQPCKNVPVPVTAHDGDSFSLKVTYKGAYSKTLSGTLSLQDLLPQFSITSALPALVNSAIGVKNLMQIGASTSVQYVDWVLTTSSVPPDPSAFPAGQRFDCAQSSPFCPVNGAATVQAPPSVGSYFLHMAYHFSGPAHGSGQVKIASTAPGQPIAVTSWSPHPGPGVYLNSSHGGDVPFFGTTYFLTKGTTYYFYDDEIVPAGVPYPGVTFYTSSNASTDPSKLTSDTQVGSSTDIGPVSFAASTSCTSNCYIKAAVSGVVGVVGYTVDTGSQTTKLTVAGPTTGVTGTPVTFTASATGFSPTSYSWDFGDTASGGGGGGPPPPPPPDCPPIVPGCPGAVVTPQAASVAGPNPNSYTYVNTGTHTVTVVATDGTTTKAASASISIASGGPGAPSSAFSITGATFSSGRWSAGVGQTITFSAVETNAKSWDWDFGDGTRASGQTVTHSFGAIGSPNVTVLVTGDDTTTVGQTAGAAGFTIYDPNALSLGDGGRYEVRADWASLSQGTSGHGTAVSLTTDSGYFWFFNDTNIEVVVKVLDACGVDGFRWVFAGGMTNLEVQLTVTDTVTGLSKTYNNSEGTAFAPIQDLRFEACTGLATVTPAATTAPSVTAAITSSATPVAGDTVTFQATAADFSGTVSYMWDFGEPECPPIIPGCSGGGGPEPGAADGTASHKYADAATYTVSVTATSGAASATATLTVTVSGAASKPSAAYSIPSGASRSSITAPWSTAVSQTVTFTALETKATTWNWDFGDGTTGSGQTVTHAFTAVGSPTVTLTVTGDNVATFGTSTALIHFSVSDPYTLRLNNDRYLVTASWTTGSGASATGGKGTATSLTTDTGYFWFFNSSNTEVIIKVLNACSYDGHFWVFGSGLTSLGVTMTVTDTQDGTSQTYTNIDGTPFVPVQDFSTFHACAVP